MLPYLGPKLVQEWKTALPKTPLTSVDCKGPRGEDLRHPGRALERQRRALEQQVKMVLCGSCDSADILKVVAAQAQAESTEKVLRSELVQR